MDRAKFPVAVHLFLLKNNEVLLLRRYNTGYEDGNYSVIAGHLDGGEDVYSAMIREASEEAGIMIEKKDLHIDQVMHRNSGSDERIDYFFSCNIWAGEVQNIEPNKCDELRWCPVNNLPSNTIAYIDFAIKNHRDNVKFSIFGW